MQVRCFRVELGQVGDVAAHHVVGPGHEPFQQPVYVADFGEVACGGEQGTEFVLTAAQSSELFASRASAVENVGASPIIDLQFSEQR